MKTRVFALFLMFAGIIAAQITIDENFDEWYGQPPAYEDTTGDGGSIDFHRLWLADDSEYLYYCFDVGSEINLQDQNDITMYIDLDNNPSTGKSVNGIGAEIEYVFGDRGGKAYKNGSSFSISHPGLFLITAPTVTSDIFEGLIKKNLTNLGFSWSDSIKVLLKNGVSGDMLPDNGETVSYQLNSAPGTYYTDYSITKTDSSYLRFMTWNVEYDGITEPQKREQFKRIITNIDPDIITFQEIYDSEANQIAALVREFFGDGRTYFYGKQGPDNIIISKYPVPQSFAIPSASGGSHGNGAFIVDMTEKYGYKALVVSAHTPCCDNNSARQDEIDAIMAFVRDAKEPGGTVTLEQNSPIIIAGDMNLVGYNEQLNTFITGDIINNNGYGDDFTPDWDNTDFEDAKPHNPNLPLHITWYDEGSSFSPGRLDLIVYTGSVLEMVNSLALYTPSLPADTLAYYGIQADDSKISADHVPVFADFRLEPLTGGIKTGSGILPDGIKVYQNYPNPFNPSTVIEYDLGKSGEVNFRIISVTGEIVEENRLGYKKSGKHSFSLDLSGLNSGVYFYQIAAAGNISTKKMLLLK